MNIKDFMKDNLLFLDGAMGTILQKRGLLPGERPEMWNLTKPHEIVNIHRDYYDAGSNVVNANTFGANSLHYDGETLEEIIKTALDLARRAKRESIGPQEKWVSLDVGPTGRMIQPYGDLDFEDAVSVFAQTIRLGVKHGADFITIETMNSLAETKAALLAAKENSNLPVFVTNAYSEDNKLMTGASPVCVIALLEGMGADAIGVNCSYGPKEIKSVVEDYIKYASVPVIVKPNAGMPKSVNGETVYDVEADEFAELVTEFVDSGVSIVGGCCGTTPEYIRGVVDRNVKKRPMIIGEKGFTVVTSYNRAVVFGEKPVVIGERINPTGKPKFKEALINNDIDYVLREAITQQERGADILDVNVGLPEIDERELMMRAVTGIQAVCDLPLQIDTSDISAMKLALRRYNGKAMINSVNGKKESMDAIFPLVKKYGGVVVALTLDENGIPETAIGRVEIAQKILREAAKYGIRKKDIVFDPLALTISADNDAGRVTLEAVELITRELGAKTVLGVSNVSFGLPNRDLINSTFFSIAMSKGLSAAILNTYSYEMMKVYKAFCAISGIDLNCAGYIDFASNFQQETVTKMVKKSETAAGGSALEDAILKGMADAAETATRQLMSKLNPIEIIKNEIIPALDKVGVGFENKTVYLPQLLMSAEAAKSAFEVIKRAMGGRKSADKGTVVIATVKGDIHDIGKNILKLLLDNYGFDTVDLGKDVSPEQISRAVVDKNAPFVGLSALMTTTVPAMEETIKLLRKDAPWCKIMVGGAVLNQEYADMIGADFYARDAMEGIRFLEGC